MARMVSAAVVLAVVVIVQAPWGDGDGSVATLTLPHPTACMDSFGFKTRERRSVSMPEFEYQVTAVTFGLGLQLGSTRTARLQEHLREVSAAGWRLVAVNHSAFEIPLAWRFFWERRVGALPHAPVDAEPNTASPGSREEGFFER